MHTAFAAESHQSRRYDATPPRAVKRLPLSDQNPGK